MENPDKFEVTLCEMHPLFEGLSYWKELHVNVA